MRQLHLCLVLTLFVLAAGCAQKTAARDVAATPLPAPASQPPAPRTGSGDAGAVAAYQKGLSEMGAKRFETALDAFSRAFAADPDMAEAYEGAGVAALELGRTAEAAGYLEKSVFLAPGRFAPHAYLAGVYKSQNRSDLHSEEAFAAISLAGSSQDMAATLIERAKVLADGAPGAQAPAVAVETLPTPTAPAASPTPPPPTAPKNAQAAETTQGYVPPRPGETRSGVLPPGESDGVGQALQTAQEMERAKQLEAARRRAMAEPSAGAEQADAGRPVPVSGSASRPIPARLPEPSVQPVAERTPESVAKTPAAPAPRPAAVPEKPSKAEADKAKAPAKGAGRPYAVLESSWDAADKAEARVKALRERGISARADAVDVGDRGTWSRVIIGAYPTVEAAREAMNLLAARHNLTGLLVVRP